MVKALVITAPGTITNPVGPKFTPGLVNPGATRVTPDNAATTLASANGGVAPTVTTDATYGKLIRFDGVDDAARVNPVPNPTPTASTVIMVARIRRAATTNQYDTLCNLSGIAVASRDLTRWPDGTIRLFLGVSLTLSTVAVGTEVHVFTAVANGASSVVGVDGVEVTGNAGTNSISYAAFGDNRGGTHAPIDILDAAFWPSALTAAQRADEVANLQQQHGLS